MSMASKAGLTLAVVLGITTVAWAQWPGRGMGQAPQIPGLFKPAVGSGAQYEVAMKGQKLVWTYAVVGKESVQGDEGYWLEMRLEGSREGGMIMKHLMVMHVGKPEIKRIIMQAPGQPPMEMPMGFMGGMMKHAQQAGAADQGDLGQKVGTEPVIVPAGTFLCDHYRKQSAGTTTDLWISTKVSPYGLVKMTSADMTMVLLKVLENETSHIKGEPQKMNIPMPGFGRQQPAEEKEESEQ